VLLCRTSSSNQPNQSQRERLPSSRNALAFSAGGAQAFTRTARQLTKAPALVRMERNQAINRLVIETGGYYIWAALFSRSKFELLENALDWLGWLIIGFTVPVTVGKTIRERYARKIAQQVGKSLPKPLQPNLSLLEVPFELLDKGKNLKPRMERLAPIAEALGFKSAHSLQRFVTEGPALQALLRRGKITILAMDLLLMAFKGQVYNWGSKWLTERWSGKKGFSGEFSIASDDYLKQKSASFERAKKRKKLISFALGFGGASLLPILASAALKKNVTLGKGLLGRVKKMIPSFNYVDAIYMSKWVILWHNVFNFAAPSLLSARDPHELREKLTKVLAFDMFYFFGDDIITGLAAKRLQHKPENQRLLKGASILHPEKGWLGLPKAKRLSEIYDIVKRNPQHPAYKLGTRTFWVGFIGTSLGLGIATNLANNLYTRFKVKKEMSAMPGNSAVPVSTTLLRPPTWQVQFETLSQ